MSLGNWMRPLGGSATSRAPAVANTSMLRCRSISSPSSGSGTIVPPAVSTSVPSDFLLETGAAADPVGLVGVELVGVGGHLLVQLVAKPPAVRLERRQVCRSERHEERLLPVVRHEAVARVEIAELLVGVDLLLGLVRADVAERERRGLQHRVTGRVVAHRAGRDPRHAPLDAGRLLDRRGGLLLDERTPVRRATGTCRWEPLRLRTWNTSLSGDRGQETAGQGTSGQARQLPSVGAVRPNAVRQRLDQLAQHIRVRSRASRGNWVADQALLDRQRDRVRVLRDRHGRVFEQVPLSDAQARASRRGAARAWPCAARSRSTSRARSPCS